MSNGFFSQAPNFNSAVQGGVDPRTGTYNLSLPLAQLVGNNKLGPELPITLSYSPLAGGNSYGLGKGVSLGLSSYSYPDRFLTLSTGEQYKTTDNGPSSGNPTVNQKKLNNFTFARYSGGGYVITYKNGNIEYLSSFGNDLFLPTRITTPLGWTLNLNWAGTPVRLMSIADATDVLCQLVYTYDSFVTLTFWPGKTESYSVRVDLANDCLSTLTATVGTSSYIWRFSYTSPGFPNNAPALNSVVSPTGLVENIVYSKNILKFPTGAPISYLPAVTSYTQIPAGNQPQILSTYSYTTSNYLGNGAAFTSNWNSYSDNLYQVLVDTYTYGSTETRVYSESSGNNMTIERTYNSLHLQISEAVHQGTSSCRQRTDIEYYVTPGQTFDSQVPQFQFPKKQTLTWTDTSKPKGQQDRSEITLTAYDGNGNQISQTDPDGTVTSWTYYSSNGETSGAGANKITLCPPDPYGFTRYVKTVTVTPKSTSQGEPVRSKTYRWQRIITPGGFAVVKNYLDLSSGGSVIANEQCTYTTTTGSNFGRMASLTHTYYNQTQSWQTSLAFSFSITGDSLTQGLTVTGHDALTASAQRQLSRFTGRTLSSTDPQGNVTQYTYDVLGRTLSRVLNPGTQYANTTSWSYRDSDHAIITTDANGNKATAYQDGLGRTLKQTIQPAGSSTESILATQTYDSFGRPLTATSYDYLPGKTTTTLALQATTVYDNWGQAQSVSYSDGHVELSASDPVAQTTKTQLQAAAGTVNPPIQGWQITHFNIQKLPLTVTTYHAVGTVASTSSQSYDSLGRLLTATDEIGNVTAYAYDTLGRVTTQTLPDGTSVARGYASSSLRALVASIAVTPLNAKAIPLGTQTFDSFGRTLTTASGGRTTTASYTGAGPFPNQVTAPSGTQQNFSYIPQLDNAILQVSAGALQQDFSYNAVTGLMGSASDSTVSNGRISSSIGDSMSWDTMGMLTGETFTPLSGSSKSASRTWSPGGRALTYADVTGKTTTTLYDSYGYPSGLNDPEATVTLARDALGRPITQTTTNIVDGSKLIISIAWNEFNQESTRTVKDGSNTPQLSIVSSYRPNGQLHHKTTSKGSATLRDEEFTFDNRNRLVKYVCTGTERPQDPYGKTLQSQSYTYDALSNIKTLVTEFDSGTGKATDTATFNYSNPSDPCQLSSVSHTHSAYPKSINLGYDANGRMTTDETGRTLAYDALGRLSTSSGGSVPTGTYRYDAFDALAMQQVGNDSHELYYRDGIQVNELVPAQNRKVRMLKIGNQSVGISDSNPPAAKTADAANDDTPQPEQGEQA